MIKILMTTDTIGGVWTYTMDLVKALERFNVQVILATLGRLPSDSQLSEVRKLFNVSLFSVPYKLEWMNDPWDDLEKTQRWLLNLTFFFHPDIIHLNSYAFDASLFRAPVVMTGHSCMLSWWEAVKNEPVPLQWNKYAECVRKGLQSADAVVAPSSAMLNSLTKYYSPLPNTKVIYNAGNNASFSPGEKEKIIFCMGRIWDEAKNIKLLIEAARGFEYPVFIAGDPKDSLKEITIPQNVTILGQLTKKQIADWLSRAAIYALPALYEPFGLSALEAAYSGCALILGKIPSLQEVWKNHALYCNPMSVDELVTHVNTLMHNETLREELSQKAFQKASEYRLTTMAENYMALYRELLEKKTKFPKNLRGTMTNLA